MIDPTQITNRNRLLPEGKGIVVVHDDSFYIDYPKYSILNTKANVVLFGTMKDKDSCLKPLEFERKQAPFNINAKTFLDELQMVGMLDSTQESTFFSKSGNVEKMKYLYSITNLRMVV